MEVGLILHINRTIGAGQCGLLKNTLIHHNWEFGLHSEFAFSKLLLKNNVYIENRNSFFLQLHNGAKNNGEIIAQDSLVLGEHASSRDCIDQH